MPIAVDRLDEAEEWMRLLLGKWVVEWPRLCGLSAEEHVMMSLM